MDREHPTSTFSTPSPGEILKRQALKGGGSDTGRHQDTRQAERKGTRQGRSGAATAAVPGEVFALGHRVTANRDRGVLLAPMIVQWSYTVGDPKAFAKWLRMKEIILADARLAIVEELRGAHYFGTYIAADGQEDSTAGEPPRGRGTACQTQWGFSRREAMGHFFALGRGEIERKTIVETDMAEFLAGLRGFVTSGGGLFRQTVFVSPQVE